MSLSLSSKEEQENLFENLKILATSIEVLNKQIQSLPDPQANTMMNEKVNLTFEGLKVINNKMNQSESYLRGNLITISQTIQDVHDKQKKMLQIIQEENTKIKEELIDIQNKNFSQIKSEFADLKKNSSKSNEIAELLKVTVNLLHETLNIMIEDKKDKA